MSEKKDKHFIVEGRIEIKFVVSGANEESAKRNAEQKVNKLLETQRWWTAHAFYIAKMTETKSTQ